MADATADRVVRRNLTANVAATGWLVLLQLGFTPLWLQLLGDDAFGLVGVHLMVIGLCAALDAGLTPALNREAAKLLAAGDREGRLGTLARTSGLCLALLGMVVAVAIAASSGWIIGNWTRGTSLATEVLSSCIVMSGCVAGLNVAANAPVALLQGAERQVILNTIRVVCTTAASTGAALVVATGAGGIEAWFVIQMIAAVIQYLILLAAAHSTMPSQTWTGARMDWRALAPIARFSRDMGVVAIAGVVLVYSDRLVLSRMLDLKVFGWYTLAALLSGGLRTLAMPLFNAVYPRMSACIQGGDLIALRALHVQSTRVLSLLVIPPASLLLLAPQELLWLWTGHLDAASGAANITRLLAIGAFINAFMHVPYAAQLGAGWTTPSMISSIAAVAVVIPGVTAATAFFGAVGAACVWPLLHGAIAAMVVPMVHRRIDLGPVSTWLREIAQPTAITMSLVGCVLYVWDAPTNRGDGAFRMGIVAVLACAITLAGSLPKMIGPEAPVPRSSA